MERTFYTYLYKDPKDGREIYVGKGVGYRAWNHFCTPSHLGNLLRKRRKAGYQCDPIISYELDEETAFEMEKFWINFFGRADLGKGTLFNRTDGGDGPSGTVQSEETRAKRSASLKGQIGHRKGVRMSDETKAKLSAINKGKPKTQEMKDKLIATLASRKQERSRKENNNK